MSMLLRRRSPMVLWVDSSDDDSEAAPGAPSPLEPDPEPSDEPGDGEPSDVESIETWSSEAVSESPSSQVYVFSINGVGGNPADLSKLGLKSDDATIEEIELSSDRLVAKAGASDIDDAADEVLKAVANTLNDGQPVGIRKVLVFLVSDLAGTVLKYAMVKASRSDEYRFFTNTTSCMIFFGTPHRACPQHSWEFTLSRLLCHLYPGTLGPWLPATVRRLADFHEEVSREFGFINQKKPVTIVSYYQVEAVAEDYEVIAPHVVSIMGTAGEVAVGIQRSFTRLSEFFQPDSQAMVLSFIENTRASATSNYETIMHFLSRYALGDITYGVSLSRGGIWDSWHLSTSSNLPTHVSGDDGLESVAGTTHGSNDSLPSKREKEPLQSLSSELKKQLSEKAINAIEVDSPMIQDTHILDSLLVDLLRQNNNDQFFALAHRYPRPLPLTRSQLLASLSAQILKNNPRRIHGLKQLLQDVREARDMSVLDAVDSVLWKTFETLIRFENGRASGQDYIIIHQPADDTLCRPFDDLISYLSSLSEKSEVKCKIIVLRNASAVHGMDGVQRETENLPEKARISSRIQLRLDTGRELSRGSARGLQLPAMREKAVAVLERASGDILAARSCIATFDQYPLWMLLLAEKTPLSEIDAKWWASWMLDVVPASFRLQAKAGLIWITFATRPLTHSEFLSILIDEDTDADLVHARSGAESFARPFCGLIETTGVHVTLASSRLAEELATQLTQQHLDWEGSGPLQERQWYALEHHPHLVLAERCIECIRKHYHREVYDGTERDEENRDEKGGVEPTTTAAGTGEVTGGKAASVDDGRSESTSPQDKILEAAESRRETSMTSTTPPADEGGGTQDGVIPTGESLHNEPQTPVEATHVSTTALAQEPSTLEHAPEVSTSSSLPPLSYAVENWFLHFELWLSEQAGAEECSPPDSISKKFKTPDFVTSFLEEDGLMQYWLKARGTSRAGRDDGNNQGARHVAEVLGLSLTDAENVRRLVAVLRLASEVRLDADPERHSTSQIIPIAVSILGDIELLKGLQAKGHFEDEDTLSEAFNIGSEAAMCYLAGAYPEFSRQNCPRIVQNAIKLGYQALIGAIADYYDDGAKPEESDPPVLFPPVLYSVAQNPIITLQQDILACFRSSSTIAYEGRNALHAAAISGNDGLVQSLIEFGISPDSRDDSGATPLFLAAKHGRLAVARRLLDQDATFIPCRRNKQTPLHAACGEGYLQMVKLLLSHEADRSAKDRWGNTPLHLALENNHVEVARVLLNVAQFKRPESPTRLASRQSLGTGPENEGQRNAEQSAELLCESSVLPTGSPTGKHDIPVAGKGDTQDSLAPKRPVNLLSRTPAGSRPQSRIGWKPHRQSWPSLGSVDINAQNSSMMTPLILAASGGHIDLIRAILDKGALANVADNRGQTALHKASAAGYNEVVEALLRAKDADADIADSDGNTALHLAAYWGHAQVVETLAAVAKDCNCWNEDSASALQITCERGRTESAWILAPRSSASSVTASFLKAARSGHVDAMELMLNFGADINAKTASGNTALHHGALNRDARVVRTLLTRRAMLDPPDASGRTPLLDAVSQDGVDCLKLLVDAGADLGSQKDGNLNSLFQAATAGRRRCVEILIRAGARLDMPAQLEKGLLSFNTDIFGLLVKHHFPSGSEVRPGVGLEGGRLYVSSESLLDLLESTNSVVEKKIRILLDAGLNPDDKIGSYGTLLHYAALHDNLELAKLLAEPVPSEECQPDQGSERKPAKARANLNAVEKDQGTALQIAARLARVSSVDIIRHLIKRGADPKLGKGMWGSPLHAAAIVRGWNTRRYLEIARVLIEADAETIHVVHGPYPTVLQAAVAGGSMPMLKMLLKYYRRFDIIAGTWGTPLHIAAKTGDWASRDVLLEASPLLSRSTEDREGRLPLHLAVCDGDVAGVAYLCDEQEAIATRRDKHGRHALHFIAAAGSVSLAGWMLDKYPSAIDDKDNDGWTALHWACRQRDDKIISLLLGRGADKKLETEGGWRPVDVAKYHGDRLAGEVMDLLRIDDDTPHREVRNPPVDEEETLPPAVASCCTRITCDSCFINIFGPRYHCKYEDGGCYDYDLCFKCFRHIKKTHYEGHVFAKFDASRNLLQEINVWEGAEEDQEEKEENGSREEEDAKKKVSEEEVREEVEEEYVWRASDGPRA